MGIQSDRRLHMVSLRTLVLAMTLATFNSASAQDTSRSVLVFSKTAAFRHDSIGPGVKAIKRLGRQHGFNVDATEDAATFQASNFKRYSAVIFLSTTGDVLNPDQERAFEQYIRAGGGFVGIHAAADTEYEWAWYGRLVGGYFDGHDAIQDAQIVRAKLFGKAALPDPWIRRDEWYNYKQFDRGVNVILKLDTRTFKGSKHGDDHPIAWYREFDGGRSFYTGLGHTVESYSEPEFLAHLLVGIQYATGAVSH
jgi:type 1 glutamine amidotransferase